MNTDNISEREGLERLENLVRENNLKEASAFASDLRDHHPSSFQIGFLYYGILVKLERYSESEEVLDELLKLYPENINLLLEKGELLIGRGKKAESKLFYDKVLFLDPFNEKAKEGVERAKGIESGDSAGEGPKVRKSDVLEDTMKESDLERFMDEKEHEEESDIIPEAPVEEEEPLNISLSEEESGFNTSLESMSSVEKSPSLSSDEVRPSREPTVKTENIPGPVEMDDTGVPEKEDNTAVPEPGTETAGKVESALDDLDRFSSSDAGELGLAGEKSEPEEKAAKEDAFVTESAALLYLKQGLFEDAKHVYGKLYKGSNDHLFQEKIEKIKRIERANRKIIALEDFLEKIRTGSVRIV